MPFSIPTPRELWEKHFGKHEEPDHGPIAPPPAPVVDPEESTIVDAEAAEGLGLPVLGVIPPHFADPEPEHGWAHFLHHIESEFHSAPVSEVKIPAEQAQENIMATAPITPAAPESEAKKIEQEFVGILEAIGKDFEKGLTVAVKYLPAAATLAGFIYPPSVAVLAPAITTADLLQKVIAAAEQRYAAMGQQDGTGAQKAADVLTVVSGAVTTLLADPTVEKGLAAAKITVSPAYIQNLVNAVVAILNVQAPTA